MEKAMEYKNISTITYIRIYRHRIHCSLTYRISIGAFEFTRIFILYISREKNYHPFIHFGSFILSFGAVYLYAYTCERVLFIRYCAVVVIVHFCCSRNLIIPRILLAFWNWRHSQCLAYKQRSVNCTVYSVHAMHDCLTLIER